MKSKFCVEVEYDNEKASPSQIAKLLDGILNEEELGNKRWEEWMMLVGDRWDLVRIKIGKVEEVKE